VEVPTEISVLPGSIVDLKLGGGDPVAQRAWALKIASDLAKTDKLPGFDATVHELVAPRTPFKTGSKEHAEDEGLHVTVAQGYGYAKEVIPESAKKLAGRKVTVGMNFNTIRFLQGRPANDEACGMVIYVAVDVDDETKALVDNLREEIGLERKTGFFPHVSIAGIAPLGSRELADLLKMREEWAPPFPGEGFPEPEQELTRKR
jgi:hypothetical protein